ncbi:class II fumarate hydratase [Salsipaludibacter albus]|uniref:class II fumarate hydratase n=1 Tax=Salsipaludibacter albus TaxID=2849650 RepID=UPI001EE3B999|nr:class II fumarate hydratase [Salsipaludibacter albus]MBY5162537.1 class II fumarate hydratase [Salsipaludibacter albus]
MTEYRTAHDTMGEMQIPADALWGASTQRAVENFPVSGQPVPAPVVHAQAMIKWAAATANEESGVVDADVADAIRRAADEVIAGELDEHFPVDTFQTGSGTSTNMNVNEVLANRAKQLLGEDLSSDVVHPNDHVNASQSSNDSFPSAVHIACARTATDVTLPGLARLAASLRARSEDFADVVKSGRTHLMDATPVTLGQEFAGYARQVELGHQRVERALETITELALGGTAVGTGLNCPPGFPEQVIALISDRTGIDFREAEDHFEAQGSRDALVELSGALKVVATSLIKIANDVRWLSSGPRTGLGELQLPEIQPGSSIMPGKVNPVIPESVRQVGAQVIGNDAAVTVGGLSGELELNVMIPLMARNVIESLELVGRVADLFVDKCLDGTTATDAGPRLVEQSLMQVTALVPEIGYERSAALAKQAHKNGTTLREAAIADGVDAELLDRVLDYRRMAEGGVM